MESARILLAVGGGGCLGAIARWSLGRWMLALQGAPNPAAFPWSTLTVNLVGCLAAGVLVGYWRTNPPASLVQPMLVSGFLGSFTTFSMFSLDVIALSGSGPKSSTLAYVLASVVGCVALASLGTWIGHWVGNR